MTHTLPESNPRAALRNTLATDCALALDEMRECGKGYELSAVRLYFSELARFRAGLRDRPALLLASDLPR